MRTVKYLVIACICMTAMLAPNVKAAFIVEAHSSGLANENFEGEGGASLRSYAVGTTASKSLFSNGVGYDWLYSYTPGIDVDNYLPQVGTDFANGHESTGLVGGAPGTYNVYITWPVSTNPNEAGCKIIVTNDGEDVVDDPVDMRTGGTGTPGGNSGWYRIAEGVRLITGTTYTVNQLSNATGFVAQRSHGVMWELVEAEAPVATVVESYDSTKVAEGDAVDDFTIVLNEQPSESVFITAGASEPNQLILNGQHNSLELVFTPGDWDVERLVTVEAYDDIVIESDHSVMIVCMTNLADPNNDPNSQYHDGFGGLVLVNITDNEAPDARITESGGFTNLIEGSGLAETYTVRLLFPPTDDVTIDIATDGQTLVQTDSGGALTFTPDNWEIEQTVYVTAADDSDLEWSHASTITHTVSSLDGGYDGLQISNVIVNIEDDECGAWGHYYFDHNRDCIVDLSDLAEIASFWLNCTQPYAENCDDLR